MNENSINLLPLVDFQTVTSNRLELLKQIVNSNKDYNLLSKSHAELTDAEILEMYESSKRIGAVMSYILVNGSPVGVIDYLIENPADKLPWLGLLMIHTQNHGKGYALASLENYEFLMRQEGLKKIRLGVIKENDHALKFWLKRGFTFYQENLRDQLTIMCFEKELS